MMTIREIMDYYGIETSEVSNSSETYFLCPFHDDRNFGSASFDEDDSWYCFSCSIGGGPVDFVAKKENISNKEAYKLISKNFQDQVNKDYEKILQNRIHEINIKTKYSLLDYKNLCKIFEDRILKKMLKSRASIDQYSKWILVCSWAAVVDKQMVDEKYATLLNLYSEFFLSL